MKKFYLNKNLINIIYQYDPTYHIYFKLNVLPYLKKIWSVKWTCIKTKTTGIDLSGFSGLNTNIHYANLEDFTYNFYYCKKICDKKNFSNIAYLNEPVILNKNLKYFKI